MSSHDEYRRNAEQAQQMADCVFSEEDKASWRKIAAGWENLLGAQPAANAGGKQQLGHRAQALKPRR
ncbi:hypothetical protein [Rhodoplanes sp. Z2-YC6860]|uniref:hypothetical protein n=1 Tax=Rhodoplanes sp. Z2-YC6860 TaxID=674703 RepID=UPI000833030F|nr:hypothetical protein [Rhodoplanes sp. Z2-YC6860]